MNKTENFFAPCPRGLEALLAEDLVQAGASAVKEVPGGAQFTGSWETCYRVNLESRIATRVLWRVGQAAYAKEDDIYRFALGLPWPKWFDVARTIRIYVTAVKSPLKSLEFITLRTKDAICDCFRAACNRRPSIDTANPDVRVHLFLSADMATLYVDTSGEPLYMRGHKIAKVEAPLKENLAAGILRLMGWQPGMALLDPMCGSGTFLLEAAQMLLGDAPGLVREANGFGFERLKNFDAALWRRLQVEAAQSRRTADGITLFGSDLSADAIARARQNLAHAGLDYVVKLEQADILSCSAPAPSGILVANPPYGERLGEAAELAALYPRLGDALKRNFAGWNCGFLSSDTRLPQLIGLKPKRRVPLFNGALECRLYCFPVVEGRMRPGETETSE